MTIEELLNCSADELEAMTTEQLEQKLQPYFCHTRPSASTHKPTEKKLIVNTNIKRQSSMERADELLKLMELKFKNELS